MVQPPRELFETLEELFQEEKLDAFQRALYRKLESNPENSTAWYWKGRLKEKENDFATAVECFERAIKNTPDQSLYHVALAQVYDHQQTHNILFGSGERDERLAQKIENAWKNAIELSPQDPGPSVQFADFLAGNRRLPDAFEVIKGVHETWPNDEPGRKTWFRVNLVLGCSVNAAKAPLLPQDALTHLLFVLQEEPDHQEANLFAGICQKKLRCWAEAEQHFLKSLPLDGGDSNPSLFLPFLELGDLYFDQENFEKARHIVEKGLQLLPDHQALIGLYDKIRQAAPQVFTFEEQPKEKPAKEKPPLPFPVSEEPAPAPPTSAPTAPSQAPSKTKSFLQQGSRIIKNLPSVLQPQLSELLQCVNDNDLPKISLCIQNLVRRNPARILQNDDEKAAFGQIWHLILKETYESSPDFSYAAFATCIPEFTRVFSAFGYIPEIAHLLFFVFRITEHFTVAFYDAKKKSIIESEAVFSAHLGNVNQLIESPAFQQWIGLDGMKDYLQETLKRWNVYLIDFVRSRREELFAAQLETCLTLIKECPFLRKDAVSYPSLLSCARSAFPVSGGPIAATFSREAETSSDEEFTAFVRGLETCYAEPNPLKSIDFTMLTEPADLTAEFALRAALEEILGDGFITEGENQILQSLKTALGISDSSFGRIFKEVARGRKLQITPSLDRDFSPDEFLYRVLVKTLEDGKVTPEEKEIIQKICGALSMEKDTFVRVFQKAKEERGSQVEAPSSAIGDNLFRLQEMLDSLMRAEKLTALFRTPRGQKSLAEIHQGMETLREAPVKVNEKPNFSVTHFFFDPDIFPQPVIAVFAEGRTAKSLQMQFKGGMIDAVLARDAESLAQRNAFVASGCPLILVNRCFDRSINLRGIWLNEELTRFFEGMTSSGGRYSILLVHYPSLNPLLTIAKVGELDHTGQMQLGLDLMEGGSYTDAIRVFTAFHAGFPKFYDVLYNIGVCYKNHPEEEHREDHIRTAVEFFKKELEQHPRSVKAMSEIGQVFGSMQKWEEAVAWFSRAAEVAPMNIPILISLVNACYSRDVANANPMTGIPEYLLTYVGRAFHFHPEHPLVVETITRFNEIFATDLRRHFRQSPIDTGFF